MNSDKELRSVSREMGIALEHANKSMDTANDELVTVKEAAEAARQAFADVSANFKGLRKRNQELEAELAKLKDDQEMEVQTADALGYDAGQREIRARCK